LLFGHAFVNQKDTPFLVFFTASVALGMWTIDSLTSGLNGDVGLGSRNPRLIESVRSDLKSRPRWQLVAATLATLLLAVAMVDILFLERGLAEGMRLVSIAYEGRSLPFINDLFRSIAEDAAEVPASIYTAKLRLAYWIMRPAILIGIAMVLGLMGAWLMRGFAAVKANHRQNDLELKNGKSKCLHLSPSNRPFHRGHTYTGTTSLA
jgi:hypothetical protein